MKAIILTSAADTLLRPITCDKTLEQLPVMGIPILEHIQHMLNRHGFTDLTLCPQPAAPTLASIKSEEGVLAVEGNLLSDANLTELMDAHRNAQADATILIRKSENPLNTLLISADSDGILTGVSEGTDWGGPPSDYESAGIYIFGPAALKALKQPLEETRICPQLLLWLKIQGLNIQCVTTDRYSIHIEDIHSYRQCHQDVLSGRLPLRLPARQIKEFFWVEEGARMEQGALVETPAYLCSGCVVERGASIGAGSVLGPDCVVKSGASLKQSLVGRGTQIAQNVQVHGGILGDYVIVDQDTIVLENTVIGSRCHIEPGCTISPNLKIWPQKRIERGTQLHDNLVWGSHTTGRLFCEQGICGEVNVDITPEFMAKLGAAVGTLYPETKIGIAWDSTPVSSMLIPALTSGLMSAGARVYRFGEQSLPITREGVQYCHLTAAIHVNQIKRRDAYYPQLEFIQSSGASFSPQQEQELEAVYDQNIFRRCEAPKLYDPVGLENFRLYYLQNLLNSLSSRRIVRNMEVRTSSETISEMLELVLHEIEQRITAENLPREFRAEISDNGQHIRLFTSDNTPLTDDQFLTVVCIVLLKHSACRRIVLPVSASEKLKEMVESNGGQVIACGTSQREFMNTVMEQGEQLQWKLCFDGIWAAITLLDYLNVHEVSFDTLINKIPIYCKKECEVECPDNQKARVITQLYDRFRTNRTDLTHGLKIYQNDGWVLMVPDRYRHYIKIITEGVNMEAAEEISTLFKKEIKKACKIQENGV